ncbi:MAG: LysM peptidoglycan-binding domain-containing protein [Steroidobacteraceae bacterium]
MSAVPVILAAGLSLLAGCTWLGGKEEAPTSAPVPRNEAPIAQGEEPQTSIDAALASGEAGNETQSVSAGPVLNASAPKSYTVQRGDTLWDIASVFLRDPWLWPEIWYVNPKVENPHLIYPGDVLALAYGADGSPQIRLESGGAARVHPLVRSSPLDGPIASIPYGAIVSFLGRPSVVSKEDLHMAPHVVALRDSHMVAGAGHEIYVKGTVDGEGSRYNVVRVGEALKDPDGGDVLGYMGTYTGTVRVERVGDPSKALITESARETTDGDLLFVDDASGTAELIPHAPQSDVQGQIISVVDGVYLIGEYQVVAINRGKKHGLEPGHVLAADEAGKTVRSPCRRSDGLLCFGKKNVKLPDERAGTMLVFKVYERMSYALVVNTISPLRVADRVRTP